jgi:hypothetical protein
MRQESQTTTITSKKLVQEAVNKSVRVVYKELNQEIIAIVRTTTLYTRLHKYMLQVHYYKRMTMVTM